jgi:hypothetical protein
MWVRSEKQHLDRFLTKPKMRAKQQAALDKRLAAATKKPTATTTAGAQATRKPTALEQASKENLGWRNADAQAELRNWN